MIYELKNEYNLNIIFYKKPNNLFSKLYKTLFNLNYCHISLNLDGLYNLDTYFNKTILSSNYSNNFNYNLDTDIITLKLNKDEYYLVLDLMNILNNKRYNFFVLFNYLNKYNIIKKNMVCSEILSTILFKLNIDINNVLNIDNFYNNLIKHLDKNNIKYLNFKGV